mmetsp:Transcript_86462/g.126520  ORF Transcript_86462/g.126520 Transcript_86462/m.126520 type:complete len:261 (-) Transcript_86462:717-1499(-)
MNFDHRGFRFAFQRAFRVSSSRERAVQSPSDSVRHRKNEPSHRRRVPVALQTVSGKGPLSLAIGIEFLWRRHNRGRLVVLNAHPDAIQAIPFDKAPKPNMRGLEIRHALHGGSLLRLLQHCRHGHGRAIDRVVCRNVLDPLVQFVFQRRVFWKMCFRKLGVEAQGCCLLQLVEIRRLHHLRNVRFAAAEHFLSLLCRNFLIFQSLRHKKAIAQRNALVLVSSQRLLGAHALRHCGTCLLRPLAIPAIHLFVGLLCRHVAR